MSDGAGAAAVPAAAEGARQLLSRADRRASILHGAAQAFARSGFAATSMDDVAAASGISRLIVYRHFASKEQLYRAVLERVSGRLRDELVAGVARQELAIGVRVLLSVAREDPDAFVLLWRHATREPVFADYAAEHRERAVSATLAFMGERLRPGIVAHWAAATIVASLVEAVLAWLEDGDPAEDDEMVALMWSATKAIVLSWSLPPGG